MKTEAQKEYRKKYRKTESGKAKARGAYERYSKTEHGRAARKKAYLKYLKTEKGRAAVRRATKKVREEVLRHYGGDPPFCACCGESRFEFLSINHENGGGNKHRKESGAGSGVKFCYWLKRCGYPEGYNVLCHNCNMAKGAYGYCPHE